MQYVYRGVVFLSEKMMLAMFLNDREYGQLFRFEPPPDPTDG